MVWDSAYMNPLGVSPKDGEATEDPQTEHHQEAAKQRYDYCVHMAQIFKSDQGKAVLKTWRENTIEASAWSPALAQQSGIEAANAHAYAREGQNAFVRDIEVCIEIAHKCKTLDDFSAMINQVGTGNLN